MRTTMSGCYTLRLCACVVCLLYTTKTVAKNYIIKSGGSDFQELLKFCEGVRVSVCRCVCVKSIKQVFIRFYFVHRCCFCCRFTFFCAAFDALCPAACDTHSRTHTHTHTAMDACTCVCVHSPSEGQRCFLPLVMGCCANIIRVFFLFYFLFLWPLEKSN